MAYRLQIVTIRCTKKRIGQQPALFYYTDNHAFVNISRLPTAGANPSLQKIGNIGITLPDGQPRTFTAFLFLVCSI